MKLTNEQKEAKKTLCDCGHWVESNGITTGYGINDKGEKHCFACCAIQDKETMRTTGKITLYLSKDKNSDYYKVTNWPGTLSILLPYGIKKGRHNMAGIRYDFWFFDEDGNEWHGTQYGDNTCIAHCKRTKKRS